MSWQKRYKRRSFSHRRHNRSFAAHNRSFRTSSPNKHNLRIIRFKLIIIIIVLIFVMIWCSVKIRPILLENAEVRADAVVSNLIYDGMVKTLDEDGFKNAKFVSVSYDNNNEPSLVTCNTVLLNRLLNDSNDNIEQKINESNNCGNVYIHMGTLTGITMLNGKGPKIICEYDLSTNVNCSLKSEFSAVGINQTKHTITLQINVVTTVVIIGNSKRLDVSCDFPISETIIVGKVPSSYSTMKLNGSTLYKK